MADVKTYFSILLALVATISVLSAIIQAIRDKFRSATILSAIFIDSSIMLYLPQINTFKAFGIEASIRENLNESYQILEKIRSVAIASSKALSASIAWEGRFGWMPFEEKNRLLDGLNKALKSIDVPESDIKDFSKSNTELIGYDLFVFFYLTENALVNMPEGATQANNINITKFKEEWGKLLDVDQFKSYLTSNVGFKNLLMSRLYEDVLNANDKDKLIKFADIIVNIFNECAKSGTYCPALIHFKEKYSEKHGDNKSYIDAMNEVLSENK